MGILFDDTSKTFTIHTKHSTYQMKVDDYGFLLHLYYGRSTEGILEYLLTYADRGFSGNPYDLENDRTYSMDALPQEFPCRGNGDFRSPAFDVKNKDGSFSCDLRYRSHSIYDGKYELLGLPAVYAKQQEAQTLEILLEDDISKIQVCLLYGVLPDCDIITRSVKVVNCGKKKVWLEKIQSACLDFLGKKLDLICFYGRHAMERNYQRIPVEHGSYVIGSRRGTSSHQYNPFMILADRQTTEDTGVCYAMSFVYSGGFKGEVEQDQYNQVRVQLGLQDELFSYPLSEGESFYAPEVVLTYSGQGLGKLSQNLHECYRTHLCRGAYKEMVRPVLINSWEAAYFNFTGETIYQLAKEAKDLGIELLVMDDGWFGNREDDNSSLGDWKVNETKLGMSLPALIQKIRDMGLKFGIWVEPEMVSEDSELYRMHPDWALMIPNRKPVRGRNQLVLDFSRKEVVNAIYEQICSILDKGEIEYLKWDMNRSITDVYSAATADQGRVLYDYVLGLYDFLERLNQRYPRLLIEGCSGGGGRFDAGMLYYTPQIWCSDNTDAIDRIKIQYGTSFGYPICTVGSHVSAVPNHQTGRRVSLFTRGVVAMAGTFGYELDLRAITKEEKEEIRQQIKQYHKFSPLIQSGLYYRLSNPFEEELGAWQIVAKDQSEFLLSVVCLEIHGNMTTTYLRLKGLKRHHWYEEQSSKQRYPAEALMEAGIPIPIQTGAYQAYQWHFIVVK